MTDSVKVALIVGGTNILLAVIGTYGAVYLKKTHAIVNSRWDEIIRMVKIAAKAEGKLEEKIEEKGRQDEKALVASLDKTAIKHGHQI